MEWIKINKQLPEKRQNVLIVAKTGYVSVGYYAREKGETFMWYRANDDLVIKHYWGDVVAWMELPEYKIKKRKKDTEKIEVFRQIKELMRRM